MDLLLNIASKTGVLHHHGRLRRLHGLACNPCLVCRHRSAPCFRPSTMLYSSLILPLSLAAIALADPITIPLSRRSNTRQDGSLRHFTAAADHVRAKYGYTTLASKLRRRGQTVGIATINQVCLHAVPATADWLQVLGSIGPQATFEPLTTDVTPVEHR